MKYAVKIPEIHIATIFVEANSPEDAIINAEKQYAVTGIPDELNYSDTMNKDQWEATEDN